MRTAEAVNFVLLVEATGLNPSQLVDSNVCDRLAIVASRHECVPLPVTVTSLESGFEAHACPLSANNTNPTRHALGAAHRP